MDSLENDENIRFEVYASSPNAFSNAPYRRKLSFMHYRCSKAWLRLMHAWRVKAMKATPRLTRQKKNLLNDLLADTRLTDQP